MQIGGTDIGLIPIQLIATNIVSWSGYLIYGLGTRVVIVGQLLRRNPSVSIPGYNNNMTEINGLLHKHTLSNIFYWRDWGF